MLGGAVVAAVDLELAEQRLDIGEVLGTAATRRDRQPHRLHGAVEVAVQLAEVRDPRVGGERGLEVDEALERTLGARVLAELDLGVGDYRVRPDQVGGEQVRAAAELEPGLEVVAGKGQRPAPTVATGSPGSPSSAVWYARSARE